jgi:pimeloyl-ACP methyl ester carboxylesterase
VRLRLYHHPDGARVAYREVGAGPPLALLHSGLLTHREWEPAVEGLAERFRVVVPDLPLHGDSEDRPRHPYTIEWFADVIGGFAAEVLGPRPLLAGHGAGAEILLQAVLSGRTRPSRLVLMPNRLHAPPARPRTRAAWQLTAQLAADLVRHAFADVSGNSSLARSWARCARSWPRGAQTQLLEGYPQLDMPVLLLWADRDRLHPLAGAEEALALLPHGQLRVLESVGFLMAYDDPVGLVRELTAFCR